MVLARTPEDAFRRALKDVKGIRSFQWLERLDVMQIHVLPDAPFAQIEAAAKTVGRPFQITG